MFQYTYIYIYICINHKKYKDLKKENALHAMPTSFDNGDLVISNSNHLAPHWRQDLVPPKITRNLLSCFQVAVCVILDVLKGPTHPKLSHGMVAAYRMRSALQAAHFFS